MKCTGKRYFYIEKKEIEYKIDYITKSKEKLKNNSI
ncbi:Uncharacterised protein [Clostridioides difficile]|nr:Uncharacterised protein [Clostridioides difficile]